MDFNSSVHVLNGAYGTFCEAKGWLNGGVRLVELNTKNPAAVSELYKAYMQAGCDIITTNTFQANRLRLKEFGLDGQIEQINKEAVRLAKEAVQSANAGCLVAGGIGPTGKYVEPLGPLTFEQVYENYREQASLLKGVDLLLIETFTDLKEARAALIAAKETLDVPIVCSMSFESGGRTVTGTDVETAIAVLSACGASAVGANCGVSLEEMLALAEIFSKKSKLPFLIKPNAGMPKLVDGKTVFSERPERMAKFAKKFAKLGASIIGGCCGTTPEHLKAISEAVKGKAGTGKAVNSNALKSRAVAPVFTIASRTKTVPFENFTIIGERINPTGREDLKAELKQGSMNLVKKEAVAQAKEGAHALDVNVSVVGTDNKILLPKAVEAVQTASNLPISIDTTDIEALELALKKCDGKPLINSTTGEQAKMEKIFPLAKKYGAAVLGLTIDERGMPKNSDERFEIAKKILEFGSKFISKEDILIDCLTRTASAEQAQAVETLKAVKRVSKELGAKTVLGVSNISHGLPNRPMLNATFLKLARKNYLDAAIYNPAHLTAKTSWGAKSVLNGKDAGAAKFIQKYSGIVEEAKPKELSVGERLYWGIVDGNDDDIVPAVEAGIASGMTAIEVSDKLISALRTFGDKFNRREVFLPQLMASAGTMKKALGRLKDVTVPGDQGTRGPGAKGTVLFATVKNDVHDIGKGIVIALLEANNYNVVDLGVDVDAGVIAQKAKEVKPDVIALSALMTTTITNMPAVIEELKKNNLNVPVMVGGAVVNDEYAKSIGAQYSKDAVGAVDLLGKLLKK